MNPEELLNQIGQHATLEQFSNIRAAALGWPPVETCPLHPAGYDIVFQVEGDGLFQRAQAGLPEPPLKPELCPTFERAAVLPSEEAPETLPKPPGDTWS